MAFPTFSPRAFLKGTDSIPMTETEWALSVRAAATSIPANTTNTRQRGNECLLMQDDTERGQVREINKRKSKTNANKFPLMLQLSADYS